MRRRYIAQVIREEIENSGALEIGPDMVVYPRAVALTSS